MPLIPTWAQVPAETGGVHCCCFITLNPIKKKKSVSHSSDPPGSLPGGGRGPFLLEGGFFIMKLLSLGDWLRVGGSSLPHTM